MASMQNSSSRIPTLSSHLCVYVLLKALSGRSLDSQYNQQLQCKAVVLGKLDACNVHDQQGFQHLVCL